MSITFNVNFSSVPNSIYSINSGTVRVAASTPGQTGQLASTSGVVGAASVNWSLVDAPSWITINSSGVVTFTSVDVPRIGLYNFAIVATDSTNSLNQGYYAITLEVLPNFHIRESASLTTITGNILDATIENQIVAYGADNTTPLTGVKFVPPTSIPSGLNFRIDGDTAHLYADLRKLSDIRGGLKTVGSSQTVTVKGFIEGTFYDHPDRAVTLTLTYNISNASTGDLTLAFSGFADSEGLTSGNVPIKLHARGDVLSGRGDITSSTSYTWSASGTASGTFADLANTDTTVWVPSSTGQVTFGLVVATSNTTSSTYTAATLQLDIATGTTWTSTSKLEIVPSDKTKMEMDVASGVTDNTFGVKITDLQGGETATITATITSVGSAPSASSPTVSISSYTDVNSSNGDISYIGFTVPSGATIGQKYLVDVSAATGGSARVGQLRFYVVCSGNPAITVSPSSSSLSFNTGTTYTTGSPLATLTVNPSSGTQVDIVNGPPGLYVDQASGKIIGKVLKGTTGTMKIYVKKTAYSTNDATSINFNVTETENLVNLSLSTSTPVVSPGSSVTLNWGFFGTVNNFSLYKNNDSPVSLSGSATSYTFTNLTANSVFSLVGTNDVGEFFAVPMEVLVSSTGTVTRLPQAPTIATVDQTGQVTVNWSPIPLGVDPSSYYSKYSDWNIIYRLNAGSDVIVPNSPFDGLSSGGTDSSRVVSFNLQAPLSPTDQLYLDMQGFSADPLNVLDSYRWNKTNNSAPFSPNAFPKFGTVTLDKTTASKNEPIKVTISGFTGDKWRIVFQDGTSTQFFPITTTSVAISFNQGATNQVLTIEVENNFSTLIPSVKLRSSGMKQVYIIDQDFIPATGPGSLGDIGFGGEAGFELTDATGGNINLEPFTAIVKALVKDETTNELKLMIATSRTSDSSSVLGTLAIDVFPILGRPHIKDLIKPVTLPVFTSIQSPIKLTTDVLPEIIIGQFNEIKLQATGGVAPYSWSADDLPLGLNISVDGTIYGSVLALGVTTIRVSVADSSEIPFIDEKAFNIIVKSDLDISTTALPNGIVNTPYNKVLSRTGGVAPYVWSLVGGALPLGLSVDPDSGTIVGSPATLNSTTDFAQNYTFVVQVVDSVGAKASKQFIIGLNPSSLVIDDLDQKILFKGEQYRLISGIFGGTAPYSNLTITDTNSILSTGNSRIRNGQIEFDVPNTVNAGNYSFTASVTDANSTVVSKVLSYSVRPALGELRIYEDIFDNFYNTTENADHYVTLTTVGGATVALNNTSPLTNGLTISYNDSTKKIDVKGPVTGGSAGNLDVRLDVTVSGTTADGVVGRTFSILSHSGAFTSVSPGVMHVTTTPYMVGDLVTLDVQRPYFNSTSTGRNSTWITRVQPGQNLPRGLSLDSKTGLIYGYLLDTDVTTSVIEYVQTTGEVVGTVYVTFRLTKTAEIAVDDSTLGTALRGTSYTGSITVLAPAIAPISATIVKGALPTGMSMAVSGNSINFSGTPTEGGFTDIWIEILDSSSPVKKTLYYKRFEVSYSSELRITTDSLPLVITGVAYTPTVTATGGVTPYSFALASGSPALPAGISISSGGVFSGTTTDTNYNKVIIIQVTDSNVTVVTKQFTMKTDSGYALSVASGGLGTWPRKQPRLADISLQNYGTDTKFGGFMVRVSGLEVPILTGPGPSSNPTITTNDSNITGVWLFSQLEGGDIVGYFRLVNSAGTSPESRSVTNGSKSVIVTISNGRGRVKSGTLNYSVVDSTGAIVLKNTAAATLSSVNNQSRSGVYSYLEGPGAFLYLSDGSIDTDGTPYIKIAGLDLNATPMNPVTEGIIHTANISNPLLGAFGLYYVKPSTTGGAIVKAIYLGGNWSAPVVDPTWTIRTQDVARLEAISTGKYKVDGYDNASNASSYYKDIKLTIIQLVKANVQSYTQQIYVDEPYTFQVNFDSPLHPTQNPSVVVTGLTGVTGTSFILDAQGRKTGYKITGLWPKDNLVTYPKNYTITVTMSENNTYVGNGVAVSGTFQHFSVNLTLGVSVDSHALQVLLTGDFGNSSFGDVNYLSYGSPIVFPANTTPKITLKNAAGGTYKLKIFGDNSDTYYGNSQINLPNGIGVASVSGTFNTSDLTTGNAGTGVTVTGVLPGSTSTFADITFIWDNTFLPQMSGLVPFPMPSVPNSTDYSTAANIVANAIPAQATQHNVNIQITEIATGNIANVVGIITTRQSCSSDVTESPILVAAVSESGNSSVPDTWNVLAIYHDKNNPNDPVTLVFPDDGTGAYDFAGVPATPTKLYVIGSVPYTANGSGSSSYKTDIFSRMSLSSATNLTLTQSILSTDPVIAKLYSLGCNLAYGNGPLTSVRSNPFAGNMFNRYLFHVTSVLSPYSGDLVVDTWTGNTKSLHDYNSNAAALTFTQWNKTSGRKQGIMKFKPITIHSAAGDAFCVEVNSMITLADGTTKKAIDVTTRDFVLARNEETGENEFSRVLRVLRPNKKFPILKLTFDDNSTLSCSSEHRVHNYEDGFYYTAADMIEGFPASTLTGKKLLVSKELLENQGEVITFNIEGNHNYFAENVLSHNKILNDCVPLGTRVTVKDGEYKNIVDLWPGDTILSYNETTKLMEEDRVTSRFKTSTRNLVEIETELGTFTCTPTHVMMTHLGWITAEKLVQTMRQGVETALLTYYNGEIHSNLVSSAKWETLDEPEWVYLAEIEKNHTLVTGSVISHNIKYRPFPY